MTDQFSVKKILGGLEGRLGEEDYLEPLEILVNSLNKNKLNKFGELAFKHQLKKRLKTRALLYSASQEQEFADPADPIFVIGLPRSGTTFLFNLLYQDKSYRSPLYWEIMNPLPITNNKYDIAKRMRKVDRDLFIGKTIIPKLRSMHAIKANMPEECEQIATMHVKSFVYMCMADIPEYTKYLKHCEFDSVFMWHKRFFQVIESKNRPQRWLLKDPSHIGNIPSILKTYPNAKFINIHRNPTEAMGSFCSLTKNIRSAFTKKINTESIGKTVTDFWSHNLNKGLDDRSLVNSNNIVDIRYSDFVKSPLLEIKRVYASLQMDMTIETENNIQQFLLHGKSKSKRKHNYSLNEFGLNEKNIKDQFSDYMLKYDF
ncbi:MAG: sulfotransferase [SAR86 cluster bacterium]|jgi:hypothetical protein|nr:sulfotransferase [SAR86 cluster bacterium]